MHVDRSSAAAIQGAPAIRLGATAESPRCGMSSKKISVGGAGSPIQACFHAPLNRGLVRHRVLERCGVFPPRTVPGGAGRNYLLWHFRQSALPALATLSSLGTAVELCTSWQDAHSSLAE